jgi:hypothetical protein
VVNDGKSRAKFYPYRSFGKIDDARTDLIGFKLSRFGKKSKSRAENSPEQHCLPMVFSFQNKTSFLLCAKFFAR